MDEIINVGVNIEGNAAGQLAENATAANSAAQSAGQFDAQLKAAQQSIVNAATALTAQTGTYKEFTQAIRDAFAAVSSLSDGQKISDVALEQANSLLSNDAISAQRYAQALQVIVNQNTTLRESSQQATAAIKEQSAAEVDLTDIRSRFPLGTQVQYDTESLSGGTTTHTGVVTGFKESFGETYAEVTSLNEATGKAGVLYASLQENIRLATTAMQDMNEQTAQAVMTDDQMAQSAQRAATAAADAAAAARSGIAGDLAIGGGATGNAAAATQEELTKAEADGALSAQQLAAMEALKAEETGAATEATQNATKVQQESDASILKSVESQRYLAQQLMSGTIPATKELTDAQKIAITSALDGSIENGQYTISLQELQEQAKLAGMSTGQLTQFLKANNIEVEGSSTSARGLWMQLREGHMAMAVMIADLALMQMATQNSSKDFQEFSRIAQVGVQTGLMALVMGADPAMALLVGIGTAAVAAGAALAAMADPDLTALNKELDTLGKKEDAIAGMMQLAGVTRDNATAALEYMKANADAADEFKTLIASQQQGIPVIQGVGDAFRAEVQAVQAALTTQEAHRVELAVFLQVMKDTGDIVKADTAAHQAYVDSLRGFTDAQMAARTSLVDLDAELQQNALELKDIETALGTIEKKTNVAQILAEIGHVSQDETAAIMASVNKHVELGAQLSQDVVAYYAAKDAVDRAAQAHMGEADAILKEGAAAKQVASDLADLQQAEIVDAAAKANKTILEDRAKTDAAILIAGRDLKDQLVQIEYDRGQDVIKQHQQDLQAWATYTDAVLKDQRTLNDALADANRTLTDAMADDAQKLADSELNARQTLANELTDLGYQHQKQEQDIANQLVTAQVTAANDIAKAYRDMLQALANDDWNTHEALENAKTENQREQVIERAAHERAVDREKFGNTVQDAETRIAEEKRVAAVKTQLADQDLAHSIMVDQRKYGDAIAAAQRTYNEEIAAARRRDDEISADARRHEQEQLADAYATYTAKVEANQKALDAENVALDHQRDLDIQRNNQKIADLYTTLNAEVTAVMAAVSAEVQAYMTGWTLIQAVIAGVSAEGATLTSQGARQMQEQLGVGTNPGFNNNLQPGQKSLIQQLTGGAHGLDMIVPPGYPNDSFTIGATSGERAVIVPAGGGSSVTKGGNTIQIQINGAQDPKAVAEEVRRVLEDMPWQ